MDILKRIKEMAGGVFNPQPVDDYVGNSGQAPANSGRIQGSLNSYRQPRNQLQGGSLPLYSNSINIKQPTYRQIGISGQPTFNYDDLFSPGLEIDRNGSTPYYPKTNLEEKQYLPYR